MKNNILKFALKLSGKDIYKEYSKLRKLENNSLHKNLLTQKKYLRKILLYSWKHVPYYKELLTKTNVVKNGNIYLKYFSNIPILTKEIIRKEGNRLYSNKKQKGTYENTSGGSTGEPIGLLQDRIYWVENMAGAWLQNNYVTKYPCKQIKLWGSERDILYGGYGFSSNIKNWLYSRKYLNSFRMSENLMYEYVDKINSFKPKLIEAYVQSIYELSRFINDKRIPIHSPIGIITSAGTLYPKMKGLIEETFNCKVFNRYGSREVGNIACSCKNDTGLHLNIFLNYIEILDNDLKPTLPGKMGGVYITTLKNYSMPLIRYRIGDIAIPAKNKLCPCGRGVPLITSVKGRDVNIFKNKNGDIIDGEYFTHLFYSIKWIKKFQVVQKTYDHILINIVKNGSEINKDKCNIESAIRKVLPSCIIEWKYLNIINPLDSGKYNYTISQVK